MAKFTVRAQLEEDDNYNAFHAAMEAEGLVRTIVDSNGDEWRLPTGTYGYEGDETLKQVLDAVVRIATSIGEPNAKILVTQSAGRMWRNLEQVKKKPVAKKP